MTNNHYCGYAEQNFKSQYELVKDINRERQTNLPEEGVLKFCCHNQKSILSDCHLSCPRWWGNKSTASKDDWNEQSGSHGRRWSLRYDGARPHRPSKVSSVPVTVKAQMQVSADAEVF